MKETKFIEQNKNKWNEFEKELKSENKDPENLSRLFIETTDDLSFTRTYYPNRSVRVYLNDIAQQVFHSIYKTKTDRKNNFASFWRYNLPEVLWNNRKSLYWATAIFVAGFLMGVLSNVYYPNFTEIILGEGYVAQTIENINNGNPMGIYGDTDPLEMFLQIGLNNIKVCFWAFVLGITAGVGTIFVLLRNAIMVGTFLHFFWARDLMEEAFFAVMLHGTLELSMIVLAGMAGLVLAKGLVFPRSYSRLQSFILSARESIMIVIAISVFLVLAAFIESYATRHTDVSNIIRGGIIFFSFAIVLSYFVIYPYILYRNGHIKDTDKDELQPERISEINYLKIKSAGEIFTEIFYFLKKNFGKHFKLGAILSLLVPLGYFFIIGSENLSYFVFDSFNFLGFDIFTSIFDLMYPWNEINNFFQLHMYPILYVVYILAFTPVLMLTGHLLKVNRFGHSKLSNDLGKNFLSALITSTLIFSIFLFKTPSASFLLPFTFMLFLFPVLIFSYTTSHIEGLNWFKGFSKARKLMSGNYGRVLSTSFFAMSMPWIICIATTSEIWGFITEIITMNVSTESESLQYVPEYVYSVFVILILTLVTPMYIYGMGLLHGSLTEISEANHLKERIRNIKFKKRAYGIEQEN